MIWKWFVRFWIKQRVYLQVVYVSRMVLTSLLFWTGRLVAAFTYLLQYDSWFYFLFLHFVNSPISSLLYDAVFDHSLQWLSAGMYWKFPHSWKCLFLVRASFHISRKGWLAKQVQNSGFSLLELYCLINLYWHLLKIFIIKYSPDVLNFHSAMSITLRPST